MTAYTYTEIFSQYRAMKRTCSYIVSEREKILKVYRKNVPEKIVVIGSGSSFTIAKSVQLSIRLNMRCDAQALAAGDLMERIDYYAPILENAWIIALSRSGSTSEVYNTLHCIKEKFGSFVLSIVCTENSVIESVSDVVFTLPWAFDRSVCQTRSASNIYAAAQTIISIISEKPEISENLLSVAEHGDEYLNRLAKVASSVVAQKKWNHGFVLADAEVSGIAEEASLALTEISRLPSRFYNVMDIRHGPIILVHKGCLIIVHVTNDGKNYQLDLVRDIVKKGADVILFSDLPMEPIEGVMCQISFGVPLLYSTAGIPLLSVAQLIAYYSAVKQGLNPDEPEGLDAWISL